MFYFRLFLVRNLLYNSDSHQRRKIYRHKPVQNHRTDAPDKEEQDYSDKEAGKFSHF